MYDLITTNIYMKSTNGEQISNFVIFSGLHADGICAAELIAFCGQIALNGRVQGTFIHVNGALI